MKIILTLLAALEPLRDAVEKISARTPIGSLLRTRDWERMPVALRERGQFSAGVESIRVLQAIQDRLSGQLKLQRERLANGKDATFDRSSFIDSIRDIARDEGLTPAKEELRGGLQDITSIKRLGLVYDMQTGFAQGHARWKLDQSEGALLLFPAQEFTRVESRRAPREDWPKRFAEAAQAAGDDDALRIQRETGRMIALKTSPIWEELSRFGVPWPPFDFSSGMGLEDIDRDEALALKLISPGQKLTPSEQDFNEGLQASLENLSPELRHQLKRHFGDQIDIAGAVVSWKGQAARTPRPRVARPPEPEREDRSPDEAEIMALRAEANGWSKAAADTIRTMPPAVTNTLQSAAFRADRLRNGFYNPASKEIVLHPDATDWCGHPDTARHEVGHHVHYVFDIVTRDKVDPELTAAMAADSKVFEKWMKERRGDGWRSQVSSAKRRTAQAITTDIEALYGITDFMQQPIGTRRKVARFADMVLGVTSARYGWGHSRAYMKSQNHCEMESFANAFAAVVADEGDDPAFLKSFPNVVAFVRRKLRVQS